MFNSHAVNFQESSKLQSIQNAMSVDVEEYFQVSAFEKIIDKKDWDTCESRVVGAIEKILTIFSEANVKATFFTLSWIAERHPILIRKIVDSGHELASHGISHVRATQQDYDAFKQDITISKDVLEDISGQAVKGYRAASFSIDESNMWAIDALEEVGYKYSSSIYPVKRDCYGVPDAPRFVYKYANNELLEIPITTLPMFGKNMPLGGGGFFRLYPYTFTKWAYSKIQAKEKRGIVFYFHPWEIDADQPRQKSLDFKTRFRHYLNLGKTEVRLVKLLNDFSWNRIDKIYSI
jgi:polysaccharide deacetylase family protein (PEP-CTERM system associated)